MMEADCNVEIIVLGEADVGKTSLLRRFVEDKFTTTPPKRFVSKYEKVIEIGNHSVKLILWDMSGHKAYYKLLRNYYKNVDGLLLVYDVQNANTFTSISKWLNDFKSINKTAQILIVGNKAEDGSKRPAAAIDAEDFVQAQQSACTDVSAKLNKNVNSVFRHLVQKILIAKDFIKYSNDIQAKEPRRSEDYTSSSAVPQEPNRMIDMVSTINTPNTTQDSACGVMSTEKYTLHADNIPNIAESAGQHIPNRINASSTEIPLAACVESNELVATANRVDIPSLRKRSIDPIESPDYFVSDEINKLNTTESLCTYSKSTEQCLVTTESASDVAMNGSLKENEVYELEDEEYSSLNNYGFVLLSMEDEIPVSSEDFGLFDYAEIAEEFSKKLEEQMNHYR